MANNNLYVFGIGGTGSRVLRSLTMLLASGVECGYDIIPVIIDPDAAAGDLTRTVSLMNLYQKIYSQTSSERSDFFKTEIKQIVPNYTLPFIETTSEKFKQFIRLSSMDSATKSFMEVLFSQANLEADMGIGFQGNPNMGTIVLNQFAYNEQFRSFCRDFKQNDKIFIVSSIMGGTGSSGFPLLLKLLRNAQSTVDGTNQMLPSAKLISDAVIGAVTVLPYFKLRKPENPEPGAKFIDSESYISKAKSALSYYSKGISRLSFQDRNQRIGCDALYYIGDTNNATYENVIGGSGQSNAAHFVEVASALAILDFAKNVSEPEQSTIHKEYGLKNVDAVSEDTQKVTLANISEQSRSIIGKRLTQIWLLDRFVKFRQDEDIAKNEQWIRTLGGSANFRSQKLKEDLGLFLYSFENWLKELADNRISFEPFSLETDATKHLYETVKDIESKRGLSINKNFDYFSNKLVAIAQSIKNDASADKKYMELFSKATSEIIDNKIPSVK